MIFKSKLEKDFSLWFFSICMVNLAWMIIKIIVTEKFLIIPSNLTSLQVNKFMLQSQNIFEIVFFLTFVLVIPNYRSMWLVTFFTPLLKITSIIVNTYFVANFNNKHLYNYAFLTVEIALSLTFYVYTISLGCYTRKALLRPFCIKQNRIAPT